MRRKITQRIVQTSLIIGIIISLFFVPWPIIKAWLRPLPATIQQQVDQVIDMGFDGIVVYIDKEGEESAFYTAGWKDREKKIPADSNALFKIASVGKLYVAVAITKLVHKGRLSLDKSLAYYLPELKSRIDNAEDITIRMMVQHRSGIPNYTNSPNYWLNPKDNDNERLKLVLDLPANFKPGEDYEYSNTNYLLLSKIIEKVQGYEHFRFIQEQILTPLHLNQTFGSVRDVDLNRVMSGYYVGYPSDLKPIDNGSMLATAEDLGRFIRALNDGSIFSDTLERDLYASIYDFGHTGLIPGYQTIARFHKDINTVVVQFTNTTDFDGYNWNLSEIAYNRIVKILKRTSP